MSTALQPPGQPNNLHYFQEGGLESNAQTPLNGTAPQSHIVTRTLFVHIHDTLQNLALAGPQAGLWKPTPGNETAVFSPNLGEDMDPTESVNLIRNGIMKSAKIRNYWSSFPCAIGVNVSCIPPSEVTELGKKYSYIVLPNSKSNTPEEIYRCEANLEDGAQWRKIYGKWNNQNLEQYGVIDVPGQPYIFVHLTHPAVGVMRYNETRLGCVVDKMERFENDWIKVGRTQFGQCCTMLRKNVLSKHMTNDLNLFSIQVHRLDAASWDDLGDGSIAFQDFKMKAGWNDEMHEKEKTFHLKKFLTTPYHYMARMELEYEIPIANSCGPPIHP